MLLQIFSAAGFILSAYAIYVKYKVGKSKKYRPLCDISKRISCTKAFTSRYGNIAVLPNPLYGIFFYAAMFILGTLGNFKFALYLSAFSVGGSVYLAYLSYIKQRNFCLVCTAIYIINILLFAFSYLGL